MRDYKLRKRVFNNFVDGEKLEKKTSAMTAPVGVDEDGKLWSSGGESGGNEWKEDIEFEITLGQYIDAKEAHYFINPSKTLSDFAQLGDSNSLRGKKVLLSMNDEGYISTYKCAIVSHGLDGTGELDWVTIMPDIRAYPFGIDGTIMNNLPLNNGQIYSDTGNTFVLQYATQSSRCLVAYGNTIIIGTIEALS